jgi:hypothetical protein
MNSEQYRLLLDMRNRLILFFCLISSYSVAQIVIDPLVEKTYNRAVKQLAMEDRQVLGKLTKAYKPLAGIMIFTNYNIDTLNKYEAINTNNKIDITDISLPSGKRIHTEGKGLKMSNINIPFPCAVVLKGDTLTIEGPPIFSPFITHKIANDKVISSYQEYQKRDTIFRLNLSGQKTEKINIPVNTPIFKLNTKKFKAGQVVYGEIEYLTDPYYVDDPAFKYKYIYKRLHCKYVFRAIIADFYKPAY